MSASGSSDELPPTVVERIAHSVRNAEAAVRRAGRPGPKVVRLLEAARTARTVPKRVMWMRRAAVAWSEDIAPNSACRAGCSHCCHIGVAISDVEARLIGSAVGVAPRVVAGAPSTLDLLGLLAEGQGRPQLPGSPDMSRPYGQPCPFLFEGMCSIHEVRPAMCALHHNMDVDDLLCRLVPNVAVPVPYADATMLKAALMSSQTGAKWADLRAFFPDGVVRG